MCENIVTAYFSPTKPTTIDESKSGLAVIIAQLSGRRGEMRERSYASRSVKPAEFQYSQIEVETLACVFACERFHPYICSKNEFATVDYCLVRLHPHLVSLPLFIYVFVFNSLLFVLYAESSSMMDHLVYHLA